MKSFSQIVKNIKKDFSNLKTIKVALLGDSATQFLTKAIIGVGYDHGLNLEIWEADYNQIELQVFDPTSDLYGYKPEIVIIFQSSHKLLGKYNKIKVQDHTFFAKKELENIINIYSTLLSHLKANIIFYNYTEIDDSIFGNYANKAKSSFLFQLRKLNYKLMSFVEKNHNIYLCDLSSIQNQVGKDTFFQPAIYINTEMILSIDVLPKVASKTIDIINSLNGNFKKCVIIDLDNTTWGGNIGDDGLEKIQVGNLGIGKAFSEFQYWIKKLKERGIIIAVCSKNTESIAKEPFTNHPEMVLKIDDISVFIANWNNKPDNIRHIQSIVNIGFDSMVFLDDNPFERNMVRENIPQICVPELPEDPADYLEYLYGLNLFETNSFSNTDQARTKLYQIEAQRALIKQSFANEDDFLMSLKMNSLVEPFNKFNTHRVAQLSQRSNQFNLRTIRYTDAEIEAIGLSSDYYSFTFTLEDKFEDNGLICVVILKKEHPNILFIETWLMSCRVLKRGMEYFVLNTIVNFAKEKGYAYLKGEYIPTSKNQQVENHYLKLGFKSQDSYSLLNVNEYSEKVCCINKK